MQLRLAVGLALALTAAFALGAASARADGKPAPLDVREPPFGEYDFSWLNGSNNQPASLLTVGPLTWTLYIDAYYAFQFHAADRPHDLPRHGRLPGTTKSRSTWVSSASTSPASTGPSAALWIQYGSNVETAAGQDQTVQRGYFLSASVFKYIAQAAVGWHFHALHGINLELGIFPSYVGLESYLTQENWSYTHAFVSDATPYYFFGLRAQLFVTRRLKVELWLVNGWQTFGQWHEGRAGGWFINWRPRGWLSLATAFYIGQEVVNDPSSLRPWFDNNLQLLYYRGAGRRHIRSAALSLTADVGYEHRGAPVPDGWMTGVTLANRVWWTSWLATTVRGDIFYDQRGSVVQQLPVGDPYMLPQGRRYLVGGVSVTQDFQPSPWVLFRLEYAHRESNVPYFSGHGGITGPSGIQGPLVPTFAPDLVQRDDRAHPQRDATAVARSACAIGLTSGGAWLGLPAVILLGTSCAAAAAP